MIDELSYYIALGQKITELRVRNGYTQEKLAEILNLSRVSIVNIEKGRQKPSIYLFYKIAYHFNISIADIFGKKKEGLVNSFEILSGENQLTNQDFEDLDLFLKNDIKIDK